MGPAATGIAKVDPRPSMGLSTLRVLCQFQLPSVCPQSVWAVLDLYGPVSVSIVSSTHLDEPGAVLSLLPQPGTPSEGEEDGRRRGACPGSKRWQQEPLGSGMDCWWAISHQVIFGFPELVLDGQRLIGRLYVHPGGVARFESAPPAAQSLLLTRARTKWPLCPQPLSSWRTKGRIFSCPMGTVQPHEWPATTRVSLVINQPPGASAAYPG